MNAQSPRVRLFFDQTSDEHFLVLAELAVPQSDEPVSRFSVTTFEHEDKFLERIVLADLSDEDVSRLTGTVILTIARPETRQHWLELSLSEEQSSALGLNRWSVDAIQRPEVELQTSATLLPSGLNDSSPLIDFLKAAPLPFCMLTGPEHRVTFINQLYVDLIGRATEQDLLHKAIREVLPELEGQPFFRLLDEVYRSGVSYVGKEEIAHIRNQHSTGFDDRYFDFIYHPMRDRSGQVGGIMVQATDVTERVHSRQVSEYREDQLFRQWAELDAIYRAAPVAMALVDAKTLRILRLNERQAELMGAPIGELLGKNVLELPHIVPGLKQLFQQLSSGDNIRNAIIEKKAEEGSAAHRTWLVNISPFTGASGNVAAYTSISLEVPDKP